MKIILKNLHKTIAVLVNSSCAAANADYVIFQQRSNLYYLLILNQSVRAINGHQEQELSAEDFTNMVFDRIDINGDGEISHIFYWCHFHSCQ